MSTVRVYFTQPCFAGTTILPWYSILHTVTCFATLLVHNTYILCAYSFNVGAAHIVTVSTEVYYYYSYSEYGWLQIMEQYRWLEQDLRVGARHTDQWLINSNCGDREYQCFKDTIL